MTWKTGDFNDTKTKRGDGSLVFNMREKYAKDFSTGKIADDIISIYSPIVFAVVIKRKLLKS